MLSVKPIENSRLVASVRKAEEIEELKEEDLKLKRHFFSNKLENPEVFSGVITADKNMRSLFLYLGSISKTNQPVLITGETGTGKEMIAHAVHELSGREGEYVIVNTAGLDDSMFTGTLFGHRKGAFSGDVDARKGLIENARGGTLFLDEIGDLSSQSQVKLLRLLESGEYYTIGSDIAIKSDVRVVAATNKSIHLDRGRFRRDLYYRLSAHEVEVPPLRDRVGDLPLLIDHFLERASAEMNRKKPTPPPEFFVFLETYDFPGNIRELKSMVYDAVGRHSGGTLSLQSVKETLGRKNKDRQNTRNTEDMKAPLIFTEKFPSLKEGTDLIIKEALKRAKGNQSIAAQLLEVSPSAINKRLKREKEKR